MKKKQQHWLKEDEEKMKIIMTPHRFTSFYCKVSVEGICGGGCVDSCRNTVASSLLSKNVIFVNRFYTLCNI